MSLNFVVFDERTNRYMKPNASFSRLGLLNSEDCSHFNRWIAIGTLFSLVVAGLASYTDDPLRKSVGYYSATVLLLMGALGAYETFQHGPHLSNTSIERYVRTYGWDHFSQVSFPFQPRVRIFKINRKKLLEAGRYRTQNSG